MIGQKKLLGNISNLINNNNFPRFSVVTGQKGQGKTELIIEISRMMKIPFCNIGIKIDDIREMIEMSYKLTSPIIYVICNADRMSIGAKNSLLKVIEEPPQQAYFIMELEQLENTLDTIKSRCQEIRMQDYTFEEKEEMIEQLKPVASMEEYQILNKLDNYWQMKTIIDYGTTDFYDFVFKVYNNIYKVQSANSFKFSEKLDIKNDGNGYDLELFFKIYADICLGEVFDIVMREDWNNELDTILSNCLNITYKYKQKLKINGINRQMLIDNWLLDIRKEWLK